MMCLCADYHDVRVKILLLCVCVWRHLYCVSVNEDTYVVFMWRLSCCVCEHSQVVRVKTLMLCVWSGVSVKTLMSFLCTKLLMSYEWRETRCVCDDTHVAYVCAYVRCGTCDAAGRADGPWSARARERRRAAASQRGARARSCARSCPPAHTTPAYIHPVNSNHPLMPILTTHTRTTHQLYRFWYKRISGKCFEFSEKYLNKIIYFTIIFFKTANLESPDCKSQFIFIFIYI